MPCRLVSANLNRRSPPTHFHRREQAVTAGPGGVPWFIRGELGTTNAYLAQFNGSVHAYQAGSSNAGTHFTAAYGSSIEASAATTSGTGLAVAGAFNVLSATGGIVHQ